MRTTPSIYIFRFICLIGTRNMLIIPCSRKTFISVCYILPCLLQVLLQHSHSQATIVLHKHSTITEQIVQLGSGPQSNILIEPKQGRKFWTAIKSYLELGRLRFGFQSFKSWCSQKFTIFQIIKIVVGIIEQRKSLYSTLKPPAIPDNC